jgi:hypothetical protein
VAAGAGAGSFATLTLLAPGCGSNPSSTVVHGAAVEAAADASGDQAIAEAQPVDAGIPDAASSEDAPVDAAPPEASTEAGSCALPQMVRLQSASSGPPGATASLAMDATRTTCSLQPGPGDANSALVFDWPGSAGSGVLTAMGPTWSIAAISDGMRQSSSVATLESSGIDITVTLSSAAGATLRVTFRIYSGQSVTVTQIALVMGDAASPDAH